jgi:hypothetical protein
MIQLKSQSKIVKPPTGTEETLRKTQHSPKLKRKSLRDELPANKKDENIIDDQEISQPQHELEFEEEINTDDSRNCIQCIRNQETFLGLKVDTIVRLLKVCSAFPFIIVVSSLNLSNQYTFLRSMTGMRIMNILVYVAPVVYGKPLKCCLISLSFVSLIVICLQ